MFKKLLRLLQGTRIEVPNMDELAEGHARKLTVGDPAAGGPQMLLCRVGGKVYAIDTACPHEGGHLVAGPLVDGKYALCPLHNYRFDPATGRPIGASCPKAHTYKVLESNGRAEVCL